VRRRISSFGDFFSLQQIYAAMSLDVEAFRDPLSDFTGKPDGEIVFLPGFQALIQACFRACFLPAGVRSFSERERV
jgi:hypothetical protein